MIARMRPPGCDRWTALLAAIGALGTALVLLRTAPWGAGLAGDTPFYVSAARSLTAGDGFVLWHGWAYTGAAPLFPLALAAAGRLGLDPLDAAMYGNAAAFGLTAFATALWVRFRAASGFLAAWAGLVCALSPPLAGLASLAITDALFLACAAWSLYALDRYLEGRRRSVLLAAALAAALACATRYVGAALIAAALPLLLWPRGAAALPARARDAAIFGAAAVLPLAAWLAYNVLALGTLGAPPRRHGLTLPDALHTASGEFARWTLGERGFGALGGFAEAAFGVALGGDPSAAATALQAAAALAPAAAAVAALAWLLRRTRAPRRAATERGGLAAPLAFAAAYAAALAALLPLSGSNPPPRYFAPLFAPLLVAAAIVLGALLRLLARRGPFARPPLARGAAASVPALALAAALALWLAPQAAATLDDVRAWRARGDGGFAPVWRDSATLRWMEERELRGIVWNNAQQWVYILAHPRAEHRRVPARLLTGGLREGVRGMIAEARAAGAEAHFVWFHAGRAWNGSGVADLVALPELEVAAILEDGAAFRPAAAPAPPRATLTGRLLEGSRLLASSDWDLYLGEDGRRLVYVREGCGEEDDDAPFFLRVRRAGADDFGNLGLRADKHVFREGGRCLAVRDLPEGGVAAVETGQWTRGDGELWSVRVPVLGDPAAAAIDVEALRAGAERLAAAPFEVYRDGNRLVYAREGCDAADVAAPFFLHVVPLDPADLPGERRESGFANLDFAFDEAGALAGGRCVAARELPAYRIASIRTGQWTSGEGELWSVEASFGE